MFHHLLVPLDGSQYSEQAIAPALAIAEPMGARVTLLAVTLRFPQTRTHNAILDEKAETRTREYLDKLIENLPPHAVPLSIATAQGVPSREIIDYAEAIGVDLIVMSTHGASGDMRPALGSTAWKVLQSSPCPILLQRIAPDSG